jgi:hypothetical protein
VYGCLLMSENAPYMRLFVGSYSKPACLSRAFPGSVGVKSGVKDRDRTGTLLALRCRRNSLTLAKRVATALDPFEGSGGQPVAQCFHGDLYGVLTVRFSAVRISASPPRYSTKPQGELPQVMVVEGTLGVGCAVQREGLCDVDLERAGPNQAV